MQQPNNFWRLKMYPAGDVDFGHKHTAWILEQKGVIGLGEWDDGQAQIQTFFNELQVGDIVCVVIGNQPLALTQITDLAYQMPNERITNYCTVKNETDERLSWLVNRCPVKILDWNVSENLPTLDQYRSPSLVRVADFTAQSNEVITEWFEKVKISYQKRGLIEGAK